ITSSQSGRSAARYGACLGRRGSEVQILSPRPFFSSASLSARGCGRGVHINVHTAAQYGFKKGICSYPATAERQSLRFQYPAQNNRTNEQASLSCAYRPHCCWKSVTLSTASNVSSSGFQFC